MIWRYRFTIIFFTLIFIIILGRLFYWQIVRASELRLLGEAQYGQLIIQLPQRGEIQTKDRFPIATNKITYLVFANPKDNTENDKNRIAEIYSPILNMDKATISAQLARNKYWVPLKHNVDPEIKNKLMSMKIKGVGFEDEPVRFYPEASLAAKVIGFVGKDDSGNDKGYFGLEGFYDRQLSGKTGYARIIKDAFGRPILAKVNEKSSKIDGRNLILHIDRSIQYILDDALKNGIDKYGARSAMGIIMEPKSGGILAMSTYPNFDPSHYSDFDSSLYLNPIISSSYEPGSTFKPLVMAAAINSGLVMPDTQCPICDKPVEIGGYTIHTWNDKYTPGISMTNIIRDSDNTGMVYIAKQLGLKRMYSYLKSYGIGQMTGIDLQGEMTPSLRPLDNWYPIDLATSGFGQGISLTPIQLISAFASLANEGKRMEPKIVDKIETAEGEIIPVKPKILGKPLDVRTTAIIREMLVNAVKAGEAKWAAPKNYRIAGKTGTAQIPIEGHYDANKTIASFIGYAPADKPKFVMLIIYNQPQTSIYGAETAAPTFFEVAKKLFTYYDIPPDE